MPEQVAVALRPPKSAAAVPDISECTPMTDAEMSRAESATVTGDENRYSAIMTVSRKMKPHNNAAGGPRRELKSLSDINPPTNPPTIPNMQSHKPQWSLNNSAPGIFTSCVKMLYHCMMPLRSTPDVSSMTAIISIR